MKTINNYYGIDSSIDISLFEYNLLINDDDKNNISVIYKIDDDSFVRTSTSETDINNVIQESWFEKDSFFDYLGTNESDWLNYSNVNKLNDLLQYYGYMNILGGCYNTETMQEICDYLQINNPSI